MQEVATYQNEEQDAYIPTMSLVFSSNRTCRSMNNVNYDQISVLQSEISSLKELNQKLRVALDSSNKQKQSLREKCDQMMIAHNEKVQSLTRTTCVLQSELDCLKNGILYNVNDDHQYLSSDSLSTLQDNYEHRLRELELENTKLLKRLDDVRNECIVGSSFEEISLGDVVDDFEEDELKELEELFRNCDAEMGKEETHWVGRNKYRFLMYTPYKY